MKIKRIKIENYRRLADVEIEVRQHLVLVGANDVGKSSLLRAIDLVLGASTAQLYGNLSVNDFRDPGQDLRFEVELADFSQDEKALFADEIYVDPTTHDRSLSRCNQDCTTSCGVLCTTRARGRCRARSTSARRSRSRLRRVRPRPHLRWGERLDADN